MMKICTPKKCDLCEIKHFRGKNKPIMQETRKARKIKPGESLLKNIIYRRFSQFIGKHKRPL